MIVTAAELDAIRRQALEEYPRECCGVVLARQDGRRVFRCRNVQDDLHARDPERHPRDARTAYYIDPADVLRIARLEEEGYQVAVIYHSHVDAGAYFSDTDRRQALFDGEPMYPGAAYVVASVVRTGTGQPRLAAIAAFRWDATRRDFMDLESGNVRQSDEERSR